MSAVHSNIDGKLRMEFLRCPYSAPFPLMIHPRTGAAYLNMLLSLEVIVVYATTQNASQIERSTPALERRANKACQRPELVK